MFNFSFVLLAAQVNRTVISISVAACDQVTLRVLPLRVTNPDFVLVFYWVHDHIQICILC